MMTAERQLQTIGSFSFGIGPVTGVLLRFSSHSVTDLNQGVEKIPSALQEMVNSLIYGILFAEEMLETRDMRTLMEVSELCATLNIHQIRPG